MLKQPILIVIDDVRFRVIESHPPNTSSRVLYVSYKKMAMRVDSQLWPSARNPRDWWGIWEWYHLYRSRFCMCICLSKFVIMSCLLFSFHIPNFYYSKFGTDPISTVSNVVQRIQYPFPGRKTYTSILMSIV